MAVFTEEFSLLLHQLGSSYEHLKMLCDDTIFENFVACFTDESVPCSGRRRLSQDDEEGNITVFYLLKRIQRTAFAVEARNVTYNISIFFQSQVSWNYLHNLETTCSTPWRCGQETNTSKRYFWARIVLQLLYD